MSYRAIERYNGFISPILQKQQVKHLGVTAPISFDAPRPDEVWRTAELCSALKHFDDTESTYTDVIEKLNVLFKQWIKDVAIASNMPEQTAANLGGKVQSFGNYRMGVHYKGAVIDALCVAPRYIEQSDFFGSFFELLKQQPEVSSCRAMEEAFDPVIKLRYNGMKVELLFTHLSLKQVPDDLNLRNDNIMQDLDLVSLRSLNGCRTTETILTLVPNEETFRVALRAIIIWAKNNAIYSHSLGYFDGITWAMLMARTCQLYPNSAAATLVQKFFFVFSNWQWPRPVLLDYPDNIHLALDGFMPVIKPVLPEQDLASNVCASTMKVMLSELWRGMVITNEIMQGRAPWERLFEEQIFFDFSHRYPNCIMILVHSQTWDDHLVWNDLVESKLRVLVGSLERNPNVDLVHPSAKTFSYKKGPSNGDDDVWSQDAPSLFPAPYCTMWFIGLDFVLGSENPNMDLTPEIQTFTQHVLKHGAHTNVLKEGMSIEANQVIL